MIDKSPWKFFSLAELKCKCGKCDSNGWEMDDTFMRMIVSLRDELKFPFTISSAYRCPAHNVKVSSSGLDGPHTTGKAIDILARGENAYKLLSAALRAGFTGLGIQQKGITRFIHLDILQPPENLRPWVWSY